LQLRLHDDFDNVESIRNLAVIKEAQPFLCRSGDPLLLVKGDCLMRITEQIRRPGFYLSKYQDLGLPIPTNQIDFTSRLGPEIPEQNFVT
jgi:hypothetical protein